MADRFDLDVEESQIEAFLTKLRDLCLLDPDYGLRMTPVQRIHAVGRIREATVHYLRRNWTGRTISNDEREFLSKLFVAFRRGDIVGGFELCQASSHILSDSKLSTFLLTNFREAVVNSLSTSPTRVSKRPYTQYDLINPNALLGRFRRLIFALISPTSAALMAPIVAFAFQIFFQTTDIWIDGVVENLVVWFQYPVATILVLALSVMIHEMGHAILCYRFGGEVRRMGFLLFYGFLPSFFCDVTDSYFMPKGRRILVFAGGGLAQLVLWSISMLVWRSTEPGSIINIYASFFCMVNGFSWFFNLLPIMKSDGYYIMSDLLGIENFHERSGEHCRSSIKRLLGFHVTAANEALSWLTRTAYWGYFGVTNLILALNVYLLVFSLTTRWSVISVLDQIFIVLALVGMARQLIFQVAAFGTTVREKVADLAARLRLGKLHGRAIVLSIGILILCVPVPYRVRVHGVVVPKELVTVWSRVDGVIATTHLGEGDEVRKSQRVLELTNADLTSRLKRAKLEMDRATEESRARLAPLTPMEMVLEQRRLEKVQTAWEGNQAVTSILENAFQNGMVSWSQLSAWTPESLRREGELGVAQAGFAHRVAGPAGWDIEAEREGLRSITAKIAGLQHSVESLNVVSPISGILVGPNLRERRGEHVKSGHVLFQVAHPDKVLALYVPEEEVPDVATGDRVLFAPATGGPLVQASVATIGTETQPAPERGSPQRRSHFPRATVVSVIAQPQDGDLSSVPLGVTGYAKVSLGRHPLIYVTLWKGWLTLKSHLWATF